MDLRTHNTQMESEHPRKGSMANLEYVPMHSTSMVKKVNIAYLDISGK